MSLPSIKVLLIAVIYGVVTISCATTRLTQMPRNTVPAAKDEKSAEFKKIRLTYSDNTLLERRNVIVRYNADYFRVLTRRGDLIQELKYNDFRIVEFSNSHFGMEYMISGGIIGLLLPSLFKEGQWHIGSMLPSARNVSLGGWMRETTYSVAGCAAGAFIGYQIGSRIFYNWREFFIVTRAPQNNAMLPIPPPAFLSISFNLFKYPHK